MKQIIITFLFFIVAIASGFAQANIVNNIDSGKKVVRVIDSGKIVSQALDSDFEVSDIMFGKNMSTGIIHVDVPSISECTINIYTSSDHTLLYNSNEQRNFSLFPGLYDVEISGMIVKNIPVYKALDTRIKTGTLNITYDSLWTLYDENKVKTIDSSSSPKKVIFPKGIYQLETKNSSYAVEIKDGQTLEYHDIISHKAQTQQLNTPDSSSTTTQQLNIQDSNKINQPSTLNTTNSNQTEIIKPQVPTSLPNEKKWEIKQTPTKGANGRIFLQVSKEVECIITISQPLTEKEVHYSGILTKERSFPLVPGTYNIKISGSSVKDVPVQKGKDTRIKAGILNVKGSGIWTLYNEKKDKEIYFSTAAKKIGLPIGNYQLEINGKMQRVIIKDGETLNF